MFTRLDAAVADIDSAQRAVEIAEVKYRKGGSVDAVNKANRRLADAHYEYRCVSGGNGPPENRR